MVLHTVLMHFLYSRGLCDKSIYTHNHTSHTHTHKSNGSSFEVPSTRASTNNDQFRLTLFSLGMFFFSFNSRWVVCWLLVIDFLVWLFAACGLKMQKDSQRTPFKQFHFLFDVYICTNNTETQTHSDHAMDIWASKHVNMCTLCVLTMSKAIVEAAISNIYVKFSEHFFSPLVEYIYTTVKSRSNIQT